MYMPMISDSRIVHRYKSGDHFVQIRTDIKVPPNMIQYAHLAVVFEDLEKEPVFFVSAELNETEKALSDVGIESNLNASGAPTYFLCTFDENGHKNYGASTKWADFETFTREALRIINSKFRDPQ